MRNLLFIIPSLVGGGAERTLLNLLQKIDRNRYNIYLVVVSRFGPYIETVPDHVNIIYLFNNHTYVRILSYLQRRFGIKRPFRKKMEHMVRGSFDVSISFLDCIFTDLLFSVKDGGKRYAFVHSSYQTHENYSRNFKIESYKEMVRENRYKKLDGLFFVSNDARCEFEALFGETVPSKVIYNMVNRERVLDMAGPDVKRDHDAPLRFIAVGSLLPVKGFDRLIEATRIVRDNGHHFKLRIAGTGPEKEKLEFLISKHDLAEHVELLGFLDNPYSEMRNSDVFIMSSISEALPTVLCEAMILGLPCVVTDCSGCRELVDNGTYGLMANQDAESIAHSMIQYLTSPDLRDQMERQSIRRSALFNDHKVLDDYYSIFDN